ncbi:unnamed protein product [Boreogadus saida]
MPHYEEVSGPTTTSAHYEEQAEKPVILENRDVDVSMPTIAPLTQFSHSRSVRMLWWIWQHLVEIVKTGKVSVIITTHYIEEARQANVSYSLHRKIRRSWETPVRPSAFALSTVLPLVAKDRSLQD